MKKIVLLYAIAAFIACSCTGMQEAPEISGVPMVLTAYQEGPADSKTAVEDGGKQVFWEPGDEIKVFSGSRSGRFTSNATGLTEVTEFTGRLEGDDPDVADIWAVYPYSDEASFDGETITTVIPSVQVARPGTFAQGANVAIAHSTTTSLQFYNVGGGIRFSLTEEGVKKVIFEGLGGEVISGTIKVSFEDGLPKVKEVSGGSIFITLTPTDGGSFTVGEWYYLTAIPGALNSGFKLRFYKDDDTYARVVSEKAYTVKRKVFGSLSNADAVCVYEIEAASFPETEEEWSETESNVLGIQTAIQSVFDSFGTDQNIEISAEELAEETIRIEGVVSAEPSDDGEMIYARTKDGVYINIIVNSLNDSFGGPRGVSDASDITAVSRMTKASSVIPSGKKAIMLMPLLDDVADVYEHYGADREHPKHLYAKIKASLEQCGYQVDPYYNDEATLNLFRGSNLAKYDVVYINTHGSCTAKNAKGEPTTAFMTKSPVSEGRRFGSIPTYMLYKGTSEVYYWITKEALEFDNPHFNDTWFFLHACNSLTLHDMYSYLFKCGAAACSGYYLTKASVESSIDHAECMVDAFASGMDINLATQWSTTNTINVLGKPWSPTLEWDNFITVCREDVSSFHLFESRPHSLSDQVSGNVASLSWEVPKSTGEYTFQLYVNDSLIADNLKANGNKCTYDYYAANSGSFNWYVIASLWYGGEVVETFRSDEEHFTIQAIIDPSCGYPTPDAVDLGLSVKWASFNLGASKPEGFGYFFAWGETAPKNIYDWSTYKWCNGSSSSIMKYVDENEGSILYREDDAASKNLGGSWQMPSYEHFHELVNTDNCALQWTTRNGIEGYKVTSKKNGNSIFLPAGGLMMGADISSFNDHNSGYYAAEYWSSSWSTYSPAGAITLHFDMSSNHLDSGARSYGRLIRPVYPND